MEKPKTKVNLKRFLVDFRSGSSREELLRLHDLTADSLEKLLRVCVEKDLLAPVEVQDFKRLNLPPPAATRHTLSQRTELPEHAPDSGEPREEGVSPCPQCKALVPQRALICRECGHVLPGAERWARVDSKRGFFERIPPWLYGWLLALPALVLAVYVFKDILIPMGEEASDRRAGRIERQKARQREAEAKKTTEPERTPKEVLDAEMKRLISEDILASVSEDYKRMVMGSAWFGLSNEEKMSNLLSFAQMMHRWDAEVHFEVVDLWGRAVARVTDRGIELPEGGEPGR